MTTATVTRVEFFGVLVFSTGRVHAEFADGGLVCGGKGGSGLRFAQFDVAGMGEHLRRVPRPCRKCAAGFGLA